MNDTPLTCTRCHAPVDETDNYCRACGKSLKKGYGFLFTHSGIILMTLVLGPFALPCVWFSRLISPTAKWIYSVILLIIGYYFVLMCYHTFMTVQQTMHTLFTL